MKKIAKIGVHHDNDIIITDESRYISRHHAVVEIDNDIYYIKDISTNGIWVNGIRLEKGTKYRIKSSDVVMLANRIPLDLTKIFYKGLNKISFPRSRVKLIISLSVLLIIAASSIIYISTKKMNEKEIISKYDQSVVLIYQEFVFKVTFNDYGYDSFRFIGQQTINSDISNVVPFVISGTGFFVSDNGSIVTNRHVAEPWGIYSRNKVRDEIEKTLEKIKGLYGTNTRIEGISTFLGILLNGQEIPIENGLIDVIKLKKNIYKCNFVASSDKENIDIALLKLNDSSLPANAVFIRPSLLRPVNISVSKGEKACIIGYPAGLVVGAINQGNRVFLESTLKCGQVSQVNDDYNIQYDISSTNGASGSPVINEKGYVIAVNFSLMNTAGAHINYGVKSEHLIEFLKIQGIH